MFLQLKGFIWTKNVSRYSTTTQFGFLLPYVPPPKRNTKIYEKITWLVFWAWAMTLIFLISCSFLPLCLLFILFGPFPCGPSLLLHNPRDFIHPPPTVLGNDIGQVPWPKIQSIQPFLFSAHTYPVQPSAVTSLSSEGPWAQVSSKVCPPG